MTRAKAAAAAKAAVKTITPRMTRKQWIEAETIWAAGDMTKETLAEKYKTTPRTIVRHMSEYKIVRGSTAEKIRKKVEDELEKAHVEDTAIIVARIRETKEEHYKMVSGLGKLTWAEILNAKQKNLPVSSVAANLKALETAIGNIKKIREEKWAILGLDKEDITEDEGLPDLVVSELTADEVTKLRNRDHTAFDELPDVPHDADLSEEEDDGVVETE